MSLTRTMLAAAAIILTGIAGPAAAEISINGKALDAPTEDALEAAYGAIPDGRYWYDPFSGLWGVEKGPSGGRILPGLDFGAALPANASGGGEGRLTSVFVNGREIHPEELALLMAMFGAVNPGRYWLGPTLTGGYEGGPAIFDLRASAQQSAGGAGYNKSTLFGDLMSDGQCSGYFDPSSGASVMTGNC